MILKKKEIFIGGRNVFYWEKNESKKEAIVFLHGFPGSHRGLVDLARSFSDCRVVIPDLPGCGQSEPLAEAYDLKHYAEWLRSFLDALSLKKIIVVGHSFGSRIALVFSVHYPEYLDKMVFVTPVASIEGLIARAASVEYKIAEILPENLRRPWLANPLYQKIEHAIIFKSVKGKRKAELIRKDRLEYERIDPATTVGIFEEFYQGSLLKEAEKIAVKTLVIAADKDEIAPLPHVKTLAEHIPRSKLVVMKNSGHLVVLERPTKTAHIIRTWLEEK